MISRFDCCHPEELINLFLKFCVLIWYSKRYMCVEGRKRKSLLRWLCITKGCSRLSCVTNGRKLAHAPMETTANLLTVLGSYVQSSATHATKLRSAGWSLLGWYAHMAIDAISVMHLLNKRKLYHNLSPEQWSWTDKIIVWERGLFVWLKTWTVHNILDCVITNTDRHELKIIMKK